MQCPKCQHQRKDNDGLPSWQCPACGIAYQKYIAATERSASSPKKPQLTEIYQDTLPSYRFRHFRILILLLILLGVAADAWITEYRVSSWQQPLQVVIYPINGDGSHQAAEYILGLQQQDFITVEQFLSDEVQRYGLRIDDPLDIHLGKIVGKIPPLPPIGQSTFDIIIWSLKLRYWAHTHDEITDVSPDIRIFVLYHAATKGKRLQHSTGLKDGLIGIVHAFADAELAPRNNVVIAHEMLHTLGASDKYDLKTGLPIYPEGYAEPNALPLYPQQLTEIMAGKLPIEADKAKMPKDLQQTIIGDKSAFEIGWLGNGLR